MKLTENEAWYIADFIMSEFECAYPVENLFRGEKSFSYYIKNNIISIAYIPENDNYTCHHSVYTFDEALEKAGFDGSGEFPDREEYLGDSDVRDDEYGYWLNRFNATEIIKDELLALTAGVYGKFRGKIIDNGA